MMGVNTRNMYSCLQKCNKLNKSHLVGNLLKSIHDARTHVYKKKGQYLRIQILIAARAQGSYICNVMPHKLVGIYQSFEETYYFRLQGRRLSLILKMVPTHSSTTLINFCQTRRRHNSKESFVLKLFRIYGELCQYLQIHCYGAPQNTIGKTILDICHVITDACIQVGVLVTAKQQLLIQMVGRALHLSIESCRVRLQLPRWTRH